MIWEPKFSTFQEVLRQWTTTLDRFYSRAKGDALSRLKSSGSYLKDSGQSAPMISTRRTRRLIRRLLADANGDVERFLDKLHRSAGTPRKLRSYRGHQCEEAGVESLIGEFSHLPSLEILRAILTRAHFHNDEVSQIIQTYLHSRQQQHQKRTQGDKATLENCNTSQDEPSLEEEVEFTEQSYGVFHQQHRVHGTPSHPIHGTHIQHPVGPKPSVFLHFDTRYPTQQLHHNWYPPPPVSPKAPSPTLKDTDDARLLETTSSC
ncbi:unnamed protein product [Cyprideis torosa]|uniref:Uncharacterized protein n=1 Tax=Cyprideis torosa TaxID=163714 RepID=A0A7R8WDV6_9CRUS|nr:unnamed protein product [Cyprideis torosa]CAG0888975.1 unnamed protein product [Cyprideis torosa]